MALHRRRRRQLTTERQPDALPKTGLFAEPLRVTRIEALEPETLDDGRRRTTFLVEVRDAEDRRCSEIAVTAHVAGPERAREVQGATDLFGRIRFRMAGAPGRYHLEVRDVAAGGIVWAADDGPRSVACEVA